MRNATKLSSTRAPAPPLGGWASRGGRLALWALVGLALLDCASYKAALKGDSDCRARMNTCLEGCQPMVQSDMGQPPGYVGYEAGGGCESNPYAVCSQRCYEICE